MEWGLFFSALISSTLMPGGSEALLLYRLHEGGEPWRLVIIATAGNTLGSIITYGLGRLGNAAAHRRWLRMNEERIAHAERWFARFGQPALLLAWLPVIGDPLCLVAGLLRSPLSMFVLLVAMGKAARYTVLACSYVQGGAALSGG
ncbi:MAG: DedA family protein [Zetaproteobacteria bacterium]|nr:MAG: DedA family protein [Zetaproteobacteria bacterium]